MILSSLVLLAEISAAALAQSPPVYRPGDPGVTLPVAVDQSLPGYSPDAMLAGVEGLLKLTCVVAADGTVGDVRVVQPLFPTLDEEAVEKVKRWRFRPGTKDGEPVAVLVEIEHTFTMRGKRGRLGRVYVPGEQGVTAPRVHRQVQAVFPASLGAFPTARDRDG